MKNKLRYIILGFLFCFSFGCNVYADEYNVIVNATANKTTVTKGEEVEITVNVKSSGLVDLCDFKVTSGANLEFINMEEIEPWSLYAGNISKFTMQNDIYSTEPLTNGVNIVKLKYKVKDSGKVTVKPLACAVATSAGDEADDEIDSIDIQITAEEPTPTVDTTLNNIRVRGGTISPTFSSDVYRYIVHLDTSVFALELTASKQEYQDDIVVNGINNKVYNQSEWGNIIFNDDNGQGEMNLNVVVNGETTYSLLFVIPAAEEMENTLSSLTVNGKNIELKDGVYDYSYKVSKGTTDVDIGAVLKDSKNFKFDEGFAPGNFGTTGSVTYIALVIEPKDPSIGASGVTYNIEIIKDGASSTGGGNGNSSGGNTDRNPQTSDISMFIMSVILISSYK